MEVYFGGANSQFFFNSAVSGSSSWFTHWYWVWFVGWGFIWWLIHLRAKARFEGRGRAKVLRWPLCNAGSSLRLSIPSQYQIRFHCFVSLKGIEPPVPVQFLMFRQVREPRRRRIFLAKTVAQLRAQGKLHHESRQNSSCKQPISTILPARR